MKLTVKRLSYIEGMII